MTCACIYKIIDVLFHIVPCIIPRLQEARPLYQLVRDFSDGYLFDLLEPWDVGALSIMKTTITAMYHGR
jgi:hypothetical protein